MSFRVPRVSNSLKATGASPCSTGEEEPHPAGSWTTARRQEDGPGTWETHVSPRKTPDHGEPVTLLRRRRVCGARVGGQEQRPHRGRSLARGTGATTDGDEGVGGLHTSGDVGERRGARTRPSKGGPCGCELLEGTMSNASTLGSMSPGLQEVVERLTTRHIHGRAGWWKSPCPDLARASVG